MEEGNRSVWISSDDVIFLISETKPTTNNRWLFRFLLTVYTVDILRYNAINMINAETRQDIGYVTISKRKLRQIVEAINAGASVEQVKAELERMIE